MSTHLFVNDILQTSHLDFAQIRPNFAADTKFQTWWTAIDFPLNSSFLEEKNEKNIKYCSLMICNLKLPPLAFEQYFSLIGSLVSSFQNHFSAATRDSHSVSKCNFSGKNCKIVLNLRSQMQTRFFWAL